MSRPTMSAAMRKEKLAEVSASRDAAISTKSESAKEAVRDVDAVSSEPARAGKGKTLPKVTLYAHASVLKALRLVAVEDGVQVQEVLRRAVRDHLATRGHTFTDLTTGR